MEKYENSGRKIKGEGVNTEMWGIGVIRGQVTLI